MRAVRLQLGQFASIDVPIGGSSTTRRRVDGASEVDTTACLGRLTEVSNLLGYVHLCLRQCDEPAKQRHHPSRAGFSRDYSYFGSTID